MKRLIALLLAIFMLFALAACNKDSEKDKSEKDDKNTTGAKKEEKEDEKEERENEKQEQFSGWLIGAEDTEVELGTPSKALDPKGVYQQLTYDARMFYGDYCILGGKEAEKAYAEEMDYMDIDVGTIYGKQITVVPYRLEAGPDTMAHVINYAKNRNFMRAYFYNETGNLTTGLCAYTIDGNKLTLQFVETMNYDAEKRHLRYTMSEVYLTYTFAFEGTKLTLTDGNNTVEMHTALDAYHEETYIGVDNYLSTGSKRLSDIDRIRLSWSEEYESDGFVVEGEEYGMYSHGIAKMEENGLLTFSFASLTGEGAETYQFVYFYCGDDGLILTDGTNTYYYNDDYSDRFGTALGDNLATEDQQKLESMSSEKLEEIVQKRTDLLADLGAAFQSAGLAVNIDTETGEITMDASVLFPVDGYEVSEEGKALLKQFMAIYTDVVFDEKYASFVSEIMVEGHTDSDGEYDYNLTLSQNRADSVKAFCLSDDCGVEAYSQQLGEMLQAVGYSSDKLIYDASGNEDKDASRRVCFRFIINLEG